MEEVHTMLHELTITKIPRHNSGITHIYIKLDFTRDRSVNEVLVETKSRVEGIG